MATPTAALASGSSVAPGMYTYNGLITRHTFLNSSLWSLVETWRSGLPFGILLTLQSSLSNVQLPELLLGINGCRICCGIGIDFSQLWGGCLYAEEEFGNTQLMVDKHQSTSCTAVTDVDARREVPHKAGRCFVCLRRSWDCRSSATCSKCHGRHHVTICSRMNRSGGAETSTTSSDPTRTSEDTQRTTNALYVDAQTPILLPSYGCTI